MNMKDIKALAAVLRQADLTKLEYSEGDVRITLERTAPSIVTAAAQPVTFTMPEATPAAAEEKNDFNNLSEVRAPMVGVFYAAPAPDAKPFVRVGDTVEKGQVICIIEAMKLMNDITAPVAGRIVDICAQDGAVLEFGQTIMKIV
ncbi:Biotin carboxyl carrier protein of acetyl-CoA carboxylase [bioreactor metagenome]|uniref:Biotin carboxyl carrier protein of acetyl-CoA carboxylase n=1 Tax=bioreactor metagenome TaxID=1076179 RepID=A0A645I0H2_9ZZZZ